MNHLSGGRFQSSAPQKPTREPAAARPAQAPAPTPAVTPYQASSGAHVAEKAPKKRKKLVPIIIAAIIVIALALAAFLFLRGGANGTTGIDSSKYQAVFFTNGQVYFGKLQAFGNGNLKMTDIFYLQTQASDAKTTDSKNPQATSTDSSNVQLIKLGQEVHGPEDAMIINKDQVLFYENLKSDGKVAQTISQYKQQ